MTPGQAAYELVTPGRQPFCRVAFIPHSPDGSDMHGCTCDQPPGHLPATRHHCPDCDVWWSLRSEQAIAAQERPAPGDLREQLHALAAKWDANAARNQRNGQSLIDQGDAYGDEGLAIAEALGACVVEVRALLADYEALAAQERPAPGDEAGRFLRTAAALLSHAMPAPGTPAEQWRNDFWDWREALVESMVAAPAATLAVTAAENAGLRQQCDKLLAHVDEVTLMMVRLGGPGEAQRGREIRFDAGLPAIDQFSKPEARA